MRSRRLLAPALAAALCACAASCGDRRATGPGGGGQPPSTATVAREAFERFYRPDPDRIPHTVATRPGRPWGDFVGSDACAACHEEAYQGWKDSFHSRTLYDAVPATVMGDFSGDARFDEPEFAQHVLPWRDGDRFGMRVRPNPHGTREADTYGGGVPPAPFGNYRVLYAFGNRRHQPYVARAADGRHWVLPAYWNDVDKRWLWDGWRPYVPSCAQCHVTGIRSSERPGPREQMLSMSYPGRWNVAPQDEGWAEGSVGCENCHGPGRAHLEAVERMGVDPYRAHLAGGGAPTIYDPGKDTPRRRMEQCAQCHDFHTESSVTWSPSPTGYSRDPIRKPLAPEDGQHWPDGTPMSPCTVVTVLAGSRMGKAGVECRDCHDAHGNRHWAELVLPTTRNELCLRCHQGDPGGRFADEAAVARHARHAVGSPGTLCVECHMPRDKRFTNGVQVMSAQVHSHAFSVPTGRESERGGPRPACNDCHEDRDAAWTRSVLEAWREGRDPP